MWQVSLCQRGEIGRCGKYSMEILNGWFYQVDKNGTQAALLVQSAIRWDSYFGWNSLTTFLLQMLDSTNLQDKDGVLFCKVPSIAHSDTDFQMFQMNFGKICLICIIFVNNWRQCCVVISTDKRVLLQTCHSLALFSCLYKCFWKQIFSRPATVASSVQKVTAMELAPARSPTLDPGEIANNNISSKVSCYCVCSH